MPSDGGWRSPPIVNHTQWYFSQGWILEQEGDKGLARQAQNRQEQGYRVGQPLAGGPSGSSSFPAVAGY